MTETIRIFIADDHAIVREGLRALLATEPSLELVGEANDGLQAVSKVQALKPDSGYGDSGETGGGVCTIRLGYLDIWKLGCWAGCPATQFSF